MENRVWDEFLKQHIEMPDEMKAFLREIDAVCRKYNLTITHEDEESPFQIETYKEQNTQLLFAIKKYTRDITEDTGISLAPNYVGEGCLAMPGYCLKCKYLNYCFCAWDKPAQERLLSRISNSKNN